MIKIYIWGLSFGYMIKAVIFDYGGVLSEEGELRTFGEMYAPKFNADPEEFNRVVIDAWNLARVNKIHSRLFWRKLAGFLSTDEKNLRTDFLDFFKGFRYEVLDLAKRLKKNYRLGLLSNQIEDWLEEMIENHKLKEVFDIIVTSYGSRVAKPDISIFKEVVEKLKVNPPECVYIDDLEKNIPPAKKLGMKTILFSDFQQLKKELIKYKVKIN